MIIIFIIMIMIRIHHHISILIIMTLMILIIDPDLTSALQDDHALAKNPLSFIHLTLACHNPHHPHRDHNTHHNHHHPHRDHIDMVFNVHLSHSVVNLALKSVCFGKPEKELDQILAGQYMLRIYCFS